MLLALALLMPFGNAIADQGGNGSSARAAGSLTLPISGAVTGGGAFTGTVTINKFAVQNGQVVAIGFVRGAVTNNVGAVLASGLAPVTLPVTVSTLPALTASAASLSGKARIMPALYTGSSGGRWMTVQAATCGVLHLDLGAIATNLLGFNVSLSPVTLDLSGDSAGPLGGLVCQAISLLNNVVGLVGVLNSILGSLTGLLGGLTGGAAGA